MIYKYEKQIVDTPLAHKLFNMLMEIKNDKYYVLCVMAELHTDQHIQKMIDILNAGETNTNYIALAALDIYHGRI